MYAPEHVCVGFQILKIRLPLPRGLLTTKPPLQEQGLMAWKAAGATACDAAFSPLQITEVWAPSERTDTWARKPCAKQDKGRNADLFQLLRAHLDNWLHQQRLRSQEHKCRNTIHGYSGTHHWGCKFYCPNIHSHLQESKVGCSPLTQRRCYFIIPTWFICQALLSFGFLEHLCCKAGHYTPLILKNTSVKKIDQNT